VNYVTPHPDAGIVLYQTICMMQIIPKPVIPQLLAVLMSLSLFFPGARAQSPMVNPASQLVLPAEPHSFPFLWRGDSMHGRWDAHSALLIPVRLPQCPRVFYMQFDLGSPYSMFYGPVMQRIKTVYPSAVPAVTMGVFNDFSFHIGSMPVTAKEIVVKDFGKIAVDWNDTAAITIIGTIGTDCIDNRFMLINYPGMYMTTGADMPADLSAGMHMASIMYAGGRILLPASIRGKKQVLYFDTGSSAFCLMTDKATSEMLAAPGGSATAFKVNSWGKPLSAFTVPTNDSIIIASNALPLRETTYVEGVSESVVSQMMKMGISGLTGNKLFVNSMLLLDLKNKRFGLRN
jgi:hypothetical protein